MFSIVAYKEIENLKKKTKSLENQLITNVLKILFNKKKENQIITNVIKILFNKKKENKIIKNVIKILFN